MMNLDDMRKKGEEIRKKLGKPRLRDKDREEILEYIRYLEMDNERLRQNLLTMGDIMQGVLENINSIQTSINNTIRIMRPILRPRQTPQSGGENENG